MTTASADLTSADYGDIVTYTATLSPATGADRSSAYNVTLRDSTLPSGLYRVVSVGVGPAGSPVSVYSASASDESDGDASLGNGPGGAGDPSLVAHLSMVDVGGGDVEIVYAIQLLRVVQSGSSFAPDFTTAWQSHPNSAATQPGGVRSYSYGSTVEPSVSVDALPSSPAVSLVVRTDELAGPVPEAAPGSTVWLDATVTFVEGSTSSSALSITWPRGDLLYVEQVVSVVSSSTNLTTSTAAG